MPDEWSIAGDFERFGVPTEILVTVCSILAVDEYRWWCVCEDYERYSVSSDDFADYDLWRHDKQCEDYAKHDAVTRIFDKQWAGWAGPNEDIRNFRLVCRRFADIGAYFSHRNLPYQQSARGNAILRNVTQEPGLAQAVQSLTCHVNNLTFMEKLCYDCFVEIQSRPQWRSSDDERKAQYTAFSDLYDEQVKTMQRPLLEEFLPHLPALKGVELIFGKERAYLAADDTRSHRADHTKTSTDESGVLESFLVSLGSASVNLSSFRAIQLDWIFFEQPHNFLSQLFVPLHYLHGFSLELSVNVPGYEISEWERHSIPWRAYSGAFQTFRKTMSTGILQKLLRPMRELRCLKICLPEMYADSLVRPAALKWFLDEEHRFPYLRNLSLKGFECTAEELLAMLEVHKHTLRELCLGRMYLQTRSWKYVWRKMRQGLELSTACFCDDLFETNPECEPNQRRCLRIGFEKNYFDGDERLESWYITIDLNEYCCRRSNRTLFGGVDTMITTEVHDP